jgi:hypothetical protein
MRRAASAPENFRFREPFAQIQGAEPIAMKLSGRP